MPMKNKMSDDKKKLVKSTSSDDQGTEDTLTTKSSAPKIHISDAGKPPDKGCEDEPCGGVSNPVFTIGDEEDVSTVAPPTPGGEDAAASGQDEAGTSTSDQNTPNAAAATMASPSTNSLTPVETADRPTTPDEGSAIMSPSTSQPRLVKSHSLTVPDPLTPRRRHSASSPEPSDNDSQLLTPDYNRERSGSVTWSEIDRLERRRGSTDSCDEDEMGRRMSTLSSTMSDRLKDLARRFAERTERYREQTARPPTPSTGDSMESKSDISATSSAKAEEDMKKRKEQEEAQKLAEEKQKAAAAEIPVRYWTTKCCKIRVPLLWERFMIACGAIDPQSSYYLWWLAFMTTIYVYNCMACTLRAGFRAGPFYVWPEELAAHRQKYMDLFRANVTTNCSLTTYSQNGSVTLAPCFFNETEYEALIPPFPVRWKPGYETPENRYYWWAIDYFCDLMYIVDMLFVRGRLSFINNGLFETSIKECWKNYKSKIEFRLDLFSILPTDLSYMFWQVDYNSGVRVNRLVRFDIASLLPLDVLYLIPQLDYLSLVRLPRILRYDWMSLFPLDLLYFIPQLDYFSLVRLPRILRVHIFWEFFDRLDQVAKAGYIIRIIRTLTYMLFLIHLESCGYYAMSAYEGFGLNDWVYSGQGNAYIRCAYLATKTATSIGNNPKPQNTLEYGFMTAYWLSGVFVFAMLIGQIRDIFQAVSAAETHYRRSMDRAVSYMQGLQVPRELQNKVRSWFNYNWENQKTLNENSLLDGLPLKMVGELQIAVHFHTLSKVQLFQDCEKNLLYDLVVKLRPSLYLPGDYICKKGEVGTEMYILKQGKVEVVGGENDSIVFVTLGEGSVFGEISLLGIQGGNRRTASIRSKGYSNLFVLAKQDFDNAMADYPEAHKLLKKRSLKVLQKNKKKIEETKKVEAEEIIKTTDETPKMVKTVMSLIKNDSKLRRSSIFSNGSLATIQDNPDVDLASNVSDDEILRIEREERPLTADEAEKLSTERPPGTPDKAVVITMEDLQKEQSNHVTSEPTTPAPATPPVKNEKPATPPEENDKPGTPPGKNGKSETPPGKNEKSKPTQNGHIGNKVHPAEIVVEKETNDKSTTKKSKRPKSGGKLSRSNKVEPMNGSAENNNNVEIAKKNAINTKSQTEVEIPAENLVTCDVEVHREKTPSLVSVKGADGAGGAEGGPNGDIPKDSSV